MICLNSSDCLCAMCRRAYGRYALECAVGQCQWSTPTDGNIDSAWGRLIHHLRSEHGVGR